MRTSLARYYALNRLSLHLIGIMILIIIVAEAVILLPSLSRFHHDQMQIEAQRQLYLHQIATLHGALGQGRPAQPSPAHPRIVIRNKNGFLMAAYFHAPDPAVVPQRRNSRSMIVALESLLGRQDNAYAMDFSLPELGFSDEYLLELLSNVNQISKVTLIVPANFATEAIRDYTERVAFLVLVLVLMVSLPFALVVEKSIIKPLQRLIDNITRFARSPFSAVPVWKGNSDGIIDEAHTALLSLQHRTQYELAQREKMAALGEAVAKINHDMRNVLSSAVLVSDNLDKSDDPKVARSAPMVTGAINRAVTLCQQMLAYLNTPDRLALTDTDVNAMVKEIRRQLEIEISYEGPHWMQLDGDQFFRLLFNLIDNAKKAGATAISITVWRTRQSTAMDIADNGPGMDEEVKETLFKPFRTGRQGSTGLGLSIARDIAFAHGGDLRVSRSSANGTEFRLRLPHHVIKAPPKRRWWR